MPNPRQLLVVLCFFVLLSLFAGCSMLTAKNTNSQIASSQANIDPSCAYYYFLLGSKAEYEQNPDEALQMYTKAVSCDPTADYINEKIPILLIRLGKIEEAKIWLKAFIAKHPDNNTQRILLADINIHNDHIPEAIRLYREARVHDPNNETLMLRLGLLYSQQKDYKRSIEIFTTLLEKNKKSYFANLYLARVFKKTNKYAEAAKRYESALELNWSKELVLEIADFQARFKKYNKALLLYHSLLVHNKHDEQAILGIIQTYLSMGHKAKAFAELKRLRKLTKNPDKIGIIESRIYINSGMPDKAEKILTRLLRRKKSPLAEYLLAIAYFDQKKMTKSLQFLKKISPQSDQYEDSLFLQLRIYRQTKKINKAFALLKKIIADKDTRKPIYYMLLASLYQEQSDLQQSEDVLSKAIILYPDNDQLLFDLSILLENKGKHDLAMKTMEKVLKLKPNHPEALNFIGYSWADANKNLDQALTYIKRALKQKPDNGFIRDSLGWVYFRLKDYKLAVLELQKATTQQPEDPHILDHLGDAYAATGQKDKAFNAYSKALKLATEKRDKEIIQKKIEALKIP